MAIRPSTSIIERTAMAISNIVFARAAAAIWKSALIKPNEPKRLVC